MFVKVGMFVGVFFYVKECLYQVGVIYIKELLVGG